MCTSWRQTLNCNVNRKNEESFVREDRRDRRRHLQMFCKRNQNRLAFLDLRLMKKK